MVCPSCQGSLAVRPHEMDANGEIREGTLCCRNGDHNFPILQYVPRFVSSEYYAESLGFEWNLFPSTQLDYESASTERWRIYHQLREIQPGQVSQENI